MARPLRGAVLLCAAGAAVLRGAAASTTTLPSVAGCPSTLDVTVHLDQVPAPPVVTYRPARPEDIVFNQRGAVQGEDTTGQWFDLTVTTRNRDGTFGAIGHDNAGDSVEGVAGEYWPKVWLQYMRVKEEHPGQGTVGVERHGCASFPGRCVAVLPPAEIARIDERCAANLPTSFFEGLSRQQAARLDPAFLQWRLPAAVCKGLPELGPHGFAHLKCPPGMNISKECMSGLRQMVDIRDDAFEALSTECQEKVMGGPGRQLRSTRHLAASPLQVLSAQEHLLLASAAVLAFCGGVAFAGRIRSDS
eukprot:TRINITY_DN70185_c0_g1_i1.p2 TRINITY_DN70185_c0_g1~~TRINITY_DN70185_c0_g1_i1.p2  ORF type:complete len:335 (+),score=98.01 TRINITY_DN70185_c0_g1_i1:96-1007(+)